MKYTGKNCVLCGKEFTDGDDIVVCPECGSPHHRNCYKTAGECANKVRHAGKYNWNAENAAAAPAFEFAQPPDFTASADQPHEYIIYENGKPVYYAKELLDYIFFVRENIAYYMPLFVRFMKSGINVSFNLICFIFPPAYFANRKMWGWAILTSILSVILLIPVMLASFATLEGGYISENIVQVLNNNSGLINTLIMAANVGDFIMRLMLCLFGNRLYYNFAVNKIKKIKDMNSGIAQKEQLMINGGTNPLNIFTIIIINFFITAIVMFLLEIVLAFLF